MSRTGRRPGDSGTRDAILAAARSRFAASGFQATTVRAIAADAEVDPALVHHYFGTKRALFAAALDLPEPPDIVATRVLDDPGDLPIADVVAGVLDSWERPGGPDMLRALLRSGLTDQETAESLRGFVEQAILGPLSRWTTGDDRELRAALAGSQLVGLAVGRYVVEVRALAHADRERLVKAIAPTLERYLRGDLE